MIFHVQSAVKTAERIREMFITSGAVDQTDIDDQIYRRTVSVDVQTHVNVNRSFRIKLMN